MFNLSQIKSLRLKPRPYVMIFCAFAITFKQIVYEDTFRRRRKKNSGRQADETAPENTGSRLLGIKIK